MTGTSLLDRFRLDGRTALVTGAGKGIGRGIAMGLAEAGCDVVVTARTQSDIDEVADEIRALGRLALPLAGDITDVGFVESLADAVVGEMGELDIWVSNAGGADDRTPRRLDEMPDRQWDYQMDLNLRAVFTCARAAARDMVDGGSIINISSGAAVKPVPRNGPYGVAKAGVNSLTRTMAAELAPRGIRVNAVSPGPVPTEVFREFFDAKEEDLPGLAKEWGVPLGRLGTPEDVANAIVFLASPAASWITGQILTVNGGDR
ncbi:MAG: glucose 1-dehydrogenase [Actinomycetota bacterium]